MLIKLIKLIKLYLKVITPSLLCCVQYDGQRNKLVACDGNEIDTMFVDRRRDGGQAGKTLVRICVTEVNVPLEESRRNNNREAAEKVV